MVIELWLRHLERCAVFLAEEIPLGVPARGMEGEDVEEEVVRAGREASRADPAKVKASCRFSHCERNDVLAARANPRKQGERGCDHKALSTHQVGLAEFGKQAADALSNALVAFDLATPAPPFTWLTRQAIASLHPELRAA